MKGLYFLTFLPTQRSSEERVLTIDDALQDPRVDVFRDSYIIPDGILSMMDAGIYIGEKLWGVICFDVTESRRDWMPERPFLCC